MRNQTKAALAVAVIIVLAIGGVFALNQVQGGDKPAAADVSSAIADGAIVREDSRILGEEGASGVTFVEFLDFECEACGAAYPIVEDLREKYAGEVTFVIRYFPLPGHSNSGNAARAVEAAARQGELEAMYSLMYETQKEWGESQESKEDLFRTYAEDLGLDMDQYDADVTSEEVGARVDSDVADGESLGVAGTPTFYVDGELFEPQAVEDFSAVLDEALAE
ncbi:Protein-disulfide isomerase [Nocardioides alpinus]|uniref:Protein-disulfide isomerase n=1 Tax=Nocardioides alpinus TaxID=748909 RepID=A0A1I1AP30_9ACTN|nr:thioredoxin domain-containing protein [Nocardioides alpinus]SFB38083.1 Protein-disulfide isomerase [Nocardioides alpinus]